MTARAVSTTLDVVVFLLLVSASVLTLVGMPASAPDPAAGTAEESASVVATSTARINYTAGADAPGRTAHGTLAELLAAAAVSNVTVDGEPVSSEFDGFEASVANETRPVVRGREWRGQIVVAWTPYPGAHVGGELRVGDGPPPEADVHAATLNISSGMPSARADARAAADDGYGAVAEVVAGAIVEGLFPPDRARDRIQAGGAAANRTKERYRRVAALYGVDLEDELESGAAEKANSKLREAVADRIAADMRRRFDSPEAAADAVRVGTIRITIRTWST